MAKEGKYQDFTDSEAENTAKTKQIQYRKHFASELENGKTKFDFNFINEIYIEDVDAPEHPGILCKLHFNKIVAKLVFDYKFKILS